MADEKIRVLIVDDSAETRENVRKLLQFESGVEVIGAARTGREAIQIAGELSPDVILMDINMPDMDGIAATEAIRQRQGWVQIIILSVQGDANYMRRAMVAGAKDFLTKPPSIDDLISSIRRAGAVAATEKQKSVAAVPQQTSTPGFASAGMAQAGKIITLYSPKGGAGVTTLAVNLAVTLQNDESQVCIVDANIQFGDVAIFFNEQTANSIADLAPRVDSLDPDVVEDVMLTHEGSNVKILAAPPKPEHAEEIHADDVAKLLTYLRGLYSYVIVDAPSALTDVTLAALDTSDILVLITTQDIPSIANARVFLDLSTRLGIPAESILFVMNRYDKRINITPEKLSESFSRPIATSIPLDSRSALPAINRGVPFMLAPKARSQPAGRAMLSLAEAVRNQVAQLEQYSIETLGG
jgi:pilus assembly protein CpaE